MRQSRTPFYFKYDGKQSFIDQRNTEHDVRYKFTGKERDAETGFDYFGARFVDTDKRSFISNYASDLSVWLSLDPCVIMCFTNSPYMYVLV